MTRRKASFAISFTSSQISSLLQTEWSTESISIPDHLDRAVPAESDDRWQRMTLSYGGQKIVQDVVVPIRLPR